MSRLQQESSLSQPHAVSRRRFLSTSGKALATNGILGSGVAGTLLSACGGGAQSGSGQPVTLKLVMWTNPPAIKAIQQINQAFQQKYPSITVELSDAPTANYPQLQQTRLAANDVDIMGMYALVNQPQAYTSGAQKPSWQQWIDAGLLKDLSGQPFLKNYYPTALADASTYNGKIYNVTTGSYAFTGVFYNKTLFRQYQLAVPTTWSELINICQVFKSHGIAAITMGGKDVWPINMVSLGILNSLIPDLASFAKGLWTGADAFTDPRVVEVFTRMQQLMTYAQQDFMGISYNSDPSEFASGKVAMMPDGTWNGASIEQANPSLPFGYFPMPGSDNAADNQLLAGKYDLAWGIGAKSSPAHQDAALKWLSFFSEPQQYAAYVNAVGILPSQPGVALTDPFLKVIAPQGQSMTLAWDQIFVSRPNAGQYATGAAFLPQYLSPAGPISSPLELAQKTQSDWLAAAPKS